LAVSLAFFAAASASRSFGARAASSIMVSRAYRQAVAVATANPAARSAKVSPLRRWTSTSRFEGLAQVAWNRGRRR